MAIEPIISEFHDLIKENYCIFVKILNMISIKGIYYKGKFKLDHPIKTDKPIKVTIIIEDVEKTTLKLSDFSFLETQELLENCKQSFSAEIAEERRNAV
jgi:hypothetical protein